MHKFSSVMVSAALFVGGFAAKAGASEGAEGILARLARAAQQAAMGGISLQGRLRSIPIPFDSDFEGRERRGASARGIACQQAADMAISAYLEYGEALRDMEAVSDELFAQDLWSGLDPSDKARAEKSYAEYMESFSWGERGVLFLYSDFERMSDLRAVIHLAEDREIGIAGDLKDHFGEDFVRPYRDSRAFRSVHIRPCRV